MTVLAEAFLRAASAEHHAGRAAGRAVDAALALTLMFFLV